jgi:hypothetical protein
MTDRLIRITTALAVAGVAAVAAIFSYRHAYELVSTHGETGLTARLIPFTVDGLILAASMLILDASRRNQPVPTLALVPGRWDHSYGWCQPGAWSGSRPDRCAGQRLARAGVGWFLRDADDLDQEPEGSRRRVSIHRVGAPAWLRARCGGTGGVAVGTGSGADDPGLARSGPQPAGHCPGTQHRPPEGQARHNLVSDLTTR